MTEKEAIKFLENKVKALQKQLYLSEQKAFYARAQLALLQQTLHQKN
ncbi:MAG: hypothetical protein JW384_04039 [Nitrosomonadaceae bacterium]|jgi:hypothetical protein|nr:hypothetical protein [Nitrosomonadaceae bacterium]